MSVKTYLEITMAISEANCPVAVRVYSDYRQPFLSGIQGAVSEELLIRDEDVRVLHDFDSVEHARAYLESELSQSDVFVGLKPLWSIDPEVKIYLVVQALL